VVDGGLVDDKGGALPLVVIAFDRDVHHGQNLGCAASNAKGRFEIPYRYESFREAERIVQPEVDLVLLAARQLANDALKPFHVHAEPKPVQPASCVDVATPVLPESRADG
jgi:hypothetical protein